MFDQKTTEAITNAINDHLHESLGWGSYPGNIVMASWEKSGGRWEERINSHTHQKQYRPVKDGKYQREGWK